MLPDSIIKNYPQDVDVTKLTGHVKTGNKKKKSSSGNNMVESCISYLQETDWWWSPSGEDDEDEPGAYYAYTTYSYNTICTETTNGGNTYGGASMQTDWWTGGNGGGSGGSNYSRPPPVRDSTYFKGLLNKQAVAIGTMSDSAFKLAQSRKVEYSLIITQKGDVVYARNLKTDNNVDSVTMNYTTTNGEKLIGEDHTHQDDITNGPAISRPSMDMDDIYAALWYYGNSTKQDYTSFVELGDIRQAIIIEDPVKATNFLNLLKKRPFSDAYVDSVTRSPLYFTNLRQTTLNVTLYQLGKSSFSGIGFYQTVDAGKVLFTKLN